MRLNKRAVEKGVFRLEEASIISILHIHSQATSKRLPNKQRGCNA